MANEVRGVPAEGGKRGRRKLVAAVAALFVVVAGVGTVLVAGDRDGSTVTGRDGDNSTITSSGDARQPLIDPDDIVSGGPPPDGIPPLDEPRFEDLSGVDWLAAKEPVVAIEIKGDAVAYPLQILTWHEIVNDEIGGVPVAVTFCPLCNTAFAFERPVVDGKVTTFGTSGKLYNSNLVMYDRATNSYWPQVLGQAVTGPLTGRELERIPAQIVPWSEFRSAFPQARVLSRDTGFSRPYGENPYPGYDDTDNPPFLFSGETDGRLAAVERVLGVEFGDDIVAFPYFRLEASASGGVSAVNEKVGSVPVLVLWKQGTASALDESDIATSQDVGAAAAFSRRLGDRLLTFHADSGRIVDVETGSSWNLFGKATDGELRGRQLEPVDAADSFWFDWAAFHPETTIWNAD